jgi:hypothetical protein
LPAAELPMPAVCPPEPIFRLARKPNAWCPPDWAFVAGDRTFGNRFDDSQGYFRVLYAGSTRLGCFIETLARFRRGPDDPNLEGSDASADHVAPGTVPKSWLTKRCMGQAAISDAKFADVYHSRSVAYLRNQFEGELLESEGTISSTWLCLCLSVVGLPKGFRPQFTASDMRASPISPDMALTFGIGPFSNLLKGYGLSKTPTFRRMTSISRLR